MATRKVIPVSIGDRSLELPNTIDKKSFLRNARKVEIMVERREVERQFSYQFSLSMITRFLY